MMPGTGAVSHGTIFVDLDMPAYAAASTAMGRGRSCVANFAIPPLRGESLLSCSRCLVAIANQSKEGPH